MNNKNTTEEQSMKTSPAKVRVCRNQNLNANCEQCQKGKCNRDIYEDGLCYICWIDISDPPTNNGQAELEEQSSKAIFDMDLREQIEEILGDYRFHDINKCSKTGFHGPFSNCDQTVCQHFKICTCGGDADKAELVSKLLQLITNMTTKTTTTDENQTSGEQSSKAIFDMDLREALGKVFEKYTRHLTQTTEPDGTKIVSFDTVVMDAYEAKNELLQLITDREKELLERVDKEVIGKEIVPFIDMNPESKQIGYYVELGKHNLQKEQRQKLKVLEGLASLQGQEVKNE